MFGQSTKPSEGSIVRLEIILPSKSSYTNGDHVNGAFQINPSYKISIEGVSIAFTGTACTTLYHLSRSPAGCKSYNATQRFLNIAHPLRADDRIPRQLECDEQHNVPFLFVVPNRLMPDSCRHPVDTEDVRDLHRCLPPSFNTSKRPMNAPASIQYEIVATIKFTDESGKAHSLEKRQPVLLKPPGLENAGIDSKHVFKSSLTIGKALRKKSGGLSMQVEKAISIRDGSAVIGVQLRFDPATPNSQPPRLRTLRNQLRVNTIVSCVPRKSLTNENDNTYSATETSYSRNIMLSPYSLVNAHWFPHTPRANPYREEADSDTSDPGSNIAPSLSYLNGVYYTVQLAVPIVLSDDHNLAPPFHSCLISRTYTLRIKLSAGPAIESSAIEVAVPVRSLGNAANDALQQTQSKDTLPHEMDGCECDMLPSTYQVSPLPESLDSISASNQPPEYSAHSRIGTTLRYRSM